MKLYLKSFQIFNNKIIMFRFWLAIPRPKHNGTSDLGLSSVYILYNICYEPGIYIHNNNSNDFLFLVQLYIIFLYRHYSPYGEKYGHTSVHLIGSQQPIKIWSWKCFQKLDHTLRCLFLWSWHQTSWSDQLYT